ncbi:TetM/TetW/TetO/TetS family tetracycline resistance ribosomal protection protein [Dactylosporangium vinaceum]|uniref:GTP-binding protein n=1 Tax=Dactylosporangium vinaceum TaxID=53362 RepID=A0ABV5M3T9_9ACTN|nr:TetM/TetW/TetO/TetS family tetracycline resistance ribosomal protection protein [Dactylosporangium vinaceum]UAB93543.1 TetM/TetW/TetO/TetS family tetracycline resistance ribosomal protection protein [Dactylosporangium vinaceum]
MSILNLGIVAHVDAGKTSLTERLLFDAGVIDRLGSVDSGSTQTDSLDQERRRGITIKTAVATFRLGELTVNLIDTPGHPDFIAEVERALRVLDGAILVVSAVEGMQAQTRILLRTLRRLHVPTLVFINKTDRTGADPDRVLRQIGHQAIPMWREHEAALAESDDEALQSYLDDRPIDIGRLTAQAKVFPAYKGSAITGEGIDELTRAIARHLPAAAEDAEAELRATVFKIDRDRTAHVRVFAGVLRARTRVNDDKVTAIDDGRREHIGPGEIGRVHGLRTVRIGDTLGTGSAHGAVFAPPTMEATVEPVDPGQRRALHGALQRLAEQDPLIDLRLDEERGELKVKLYGEVQREVIRDTLAEEYGLAVTFGATVTLHLERPAGRGRAGAVIGKDGNQHMATLELEIAPGEGLEVRLDVPFEHLPLYVYKTVANFQDSMLRYVRAALARGGRHGWDVDDARVTVTRCGYISPVSTAGDFRRLSAELVPRALARAGTVLCEPVHRFTLDGPVGALTATLGALPRFGAVPEPPDVGPARFTVQGTIPAVRLPELERALPGLTHGEGTVEAAFEGFRPRS